MVLEDMEVVMAPVLGSTGNYASGSSSSNAANNNLHYTKSGELDMRYNTSKAAVQSSSSGGNYSASTTYSCGNNDDLNYTKDGKLDMRFSSSKAAISSGSVGRPVTRQGQNFDSNSSNASALHYKKDGTLDKRYTTTRQLDNSFKNLQLSNSSKRGVNNSNIPSRVPITKSGLPDMRTKEGKAWVKQEGLNNKSNSFPSWLPMKKDGTLDMSKAVVQTYLKSSPSAPHDKDHQFREEYYSNKLKVQIGFKMEVENARREVVTIPDNYMLPQTRQIREQLNSTILAKSSQIASSTSQYGRASYDFASVVQSEIPSTIQKIDYNELKKSFPDEAKSTLGRGAFGIVLKGIWNGNTVAVKRLHLSQLTRKEQQSFVTELKILALVGTHPNLVKLYGYSEKPPTLVMEFVELGSLSYLLHYCEDNAIEAKLTDGRIKQRLAVGIVAGMTQIHEIGIVHGDLKPANVLVSKDYTAKITDFGLASLRGKTSSSMASTALTINEDGNVCAGTGAYMGPELLDSNEMANYSCDVYSFGILLNELVQEEEPFSGEQARFHGRGPFGAANYAKSGNRPFIKNNTPAPLKKLIQDCWNASPALRPKFTAIANILAKLTIPNSF